MPKDECIGVALDAAELAKIERDLKARTEVKYWAERFHQKIFSLEKAKDRNYAVVRGCSGSEVDFFVKKSHALDFLCHLDVQARDQALLTYRHKNEVVYML